MASRPLRCPSCGGVLPAVGAACPACGFTVWRAGGGWDDQVLRGSGEAATAADTAAGGASGGAAGAAVDTVVDEAADRASGGWAAGWAASPPSPPPSPRSLSSITPPSPVDSPPSRVSLDGLEAHWSSRFLRCAGRRASAPARALPAVTPAGSGAPRGGARTGVPAASEGRQDHGAATRPVGAPPGTAAPGMPAATRPGSGPWLSREEAEQVARAAAGARQRRGEFAGAAGPVAPTAAAVSVPLTAAGFDQALSSDFRGAASISSRKPLVPPSPATTPRWAPSGASAIDFPGWFRGISNPVASSQGRSMRHRAPLPRAGVWLGAVALLFVGLLVFTAYAQRWSVRQGAGNVGAPAGTLTIAAPRSADLATVRRELAGLASVAGSPSAPVTTSRPAAARQARTLRPRLILWRDRFELTAHQTRVLDNAIVYAGALARWLKTPRSAARHAAALKAWRAWRADDPAMRTR